jgi:heat shock protein HslJ
MKPGMRQAYITFQEDEYNYNRMTGFTGCNYINGNFNLPGGDDIVFHPKLLTNNNCAGGTVESALIQALIAADSWSEKNGQLILEKRGKIIARWNPATYSNANLNGTWELFFMNELHAPFAQVFPVGRCPKVTFSEKEKSLSGHSGCHDFNSTYVINEEAIVFHETTPCDSTCKSREKNVFLSRMQQVNGYVFKDDKTLVLIEDDKPIMAFQRVRPVQASPATASKD